MPQKNSAEKLFVEPILVLLLGGAGVKDVGDRDLL